MSATKRRTPYTSGRPNEDWARPSLKQNLITRGSKGMSHLRYVPLKLAEDTIPEQVFADMSWPISE